MQDLSAIGSQAANSDAGGFLSADGQILPTGAVYSVPFEAGKVRLKV
jgi:hypothetical protein